MPESLVAVAMSGGVDSSAVAGMLHRQGVPVIGLTMHADKVIHHAMRSAGAVGCLVKSGPTEALLQAIRAAMSTTDRSVY